MQLNDICADAQDQDRGRDFELADPVTGKPVGITLRITYLSYRRQKQSQKIPPDGNHVRRGPGGNLKEE